MQPVDQKALARYLVELRRPALGWSELEALTSRARASAAQLGEAGTAARFLRALYVPEDETFFLLFEAPNRECVTRVVAHAGLACNGFAETVSSSDPREVGS